ncbi:hypothetical protein SAMN04515674_10927 [Pseudarcicella hirudinis]|uniref:Uncharacterized protein n=1 Tax=Pseudarcicella hirudinis TaxID=1079859 RepID=A0A1I5VBG3_9BACT|nr:hypothetical protein SAMN04515674_10927 [Pseudarcicella hirudinis]
MIQKANVTEIFTETNLQEIGEIYYKIVIKWCFSK